MALAFFITQLKPGFGDVADALEFALHFLVLGFHDCGVGVGGDEDRRGDEDYGAGERRGQQEMVPGIGEGFAAVDGGVKNDDGASSFSREDDRAGLGDVTRAARAVDGENGIAALLHAPGHDRQPAKAAARRTSLRGVKAQPFDHLARPLTVKRGGIEDHDAAISGPPHNRNNTAMPEGKNATLAGGIGALDVLMAEHFIAQRRTQRTDCGVDGGGYHGNLYAARPRKAREARVVMQIYG